MTTSAKNKSAFFEKYAPAIVAFSAAMVAVTAGYPAMMASLKVFLFG